MTGIGTELARRRQKLGPLRALMATGRWLTQQELIEVAGLRYGARLHELKAGADGQPSIAWEKSIHGGRVLYRQVAGGSSTVERRSEEPGVAGSSPALPAKKHVVIGEDGQGMLFGADTRSF